MKTPKWESRGDALFFEDSDLTASVWVKPSPNQQGPKQISLLMGVWCATEEDAKRLAERVHALLKEESK